MRKIVQIPDILLPNSSINLEKWATVACDQFTSQPEYWKELEDYSEGAPSTFNLIYPEVYLNLPDKTERIEKINSTMNKYLADGVFDKISDSFILVERDTPYQKGRLGLMMAVDLECYDYVPFSEVFIRATEGTVTERIPPRVEIRRHASLELPHIMLLLDDRDNTVIEPLYANRDSLPLLYDTDLNMNGGHLRGYQVKDTEKVLEKLYALLDASLQKKKYGKATNFLFAVGDGNHSLATAKAHWDNVKNTLTASEWENHPARFALVEVENLHSDALVFEPIHRVIINGGKKFIDGIMLDCAVGTRAVKMFDGDRQYTLRLPHDSIEAIHKIQVYIDVFLKNNKDAYVDYVHGEKNLESVVKKYNGTGIVMPAPEKNNLFEFIIRRGIMPRKSFSMGEAEEKRYYFEAKKIVK